MSLLKKLFGDYSQKEIKRIQPLCDQVLALEETYRAMSEEELKGQTEILKDRLQSGETTDNILPEAFATCREATRRVLGTPHFPVQILGGIILHQGRIAEMKTGEGKTQTVILPAYLNALTGEGVHVVTMNEYLARRDSEWMGKVYKYLGLTVGLVVHSQDNNERRKAYQADITYGTNNELGFDYLRDNMVIYKQNKVQRSHHYAIVDEVDSILIDEARTPLIISGQGDKSTDLYQQADRFAKTLKIFKIKEMDAKEEQDTVDGDYIVDEKARTATLTRAGVKKAEQYFNVENLMDSDNVTLLHHINQAIKARGVMTRDVDYVVKDGEVIIVDEFTGRLMFGRRYNEGLHQAIEAKEGVKVEPITDVQPPDTETKIAILKRKAMEKRCFIPDEVLEYLAGDSGHDVRTLEGRLNKVIFASKLHEEPISLSLARKALNESVRESGEEKEDVTPESIISAVCSYYKCRKEDLLGKGKKADLVRARQICAYLMCELLSLPLVSVGNLMGGRDHTTIMYSRDKVEDLIRLNEKIAKEVDDVKNAVYKR